MLAVVLSAALLAVASPALSVGDTTPPQVLSFSLTPYQIHTESSDQLVTVTMRITDDLSGVSCQDNLSVPVLAPWVGQVAGPQPAQLALRRISGDDHDGIYSGTATIPLGSNVGMWRVCDPRLADKMGNYIDLNDQTLKAAGRSRSPWKWVAGQRPSTEHPVSGRSGDCMGERDGQ